MLSLAGPYFPDPWPCSVSFLTHLWSHLCPFPFLPCKIQVSDKDQPALPKGQSRKGLFTFCSAHVKISATHFKTKQPINHLYSPLLKSNSLAVCTFTSSQRFKASIYRACHQLLWLQSSLPDKWKSPTTEFETTNETRGLIGLYWSQICMRWITIGYPWRTLTKCHTSR